MNKSILIVDDADINRSILALMFREDYSIMEAKNGEVALLHLENALDEIAIVLLDLHMPVMNGFKMLNVMKEKGYLDFVPVVLITGDDSDEAARVGYEYGVSDVIKKPFDTNIVKTRVRNVIQLYQHKNHLQELVAEQTEQLLFQAERLKETNRHIIDTLTTVVEFRNLESGQHIRRIRKFTEALLLCVEKLYPEYELTPTIIEMISEASAMHDIGKIAIPDDILLKPGRLTHDEFEIMKSHTTKGCDIVDRIASIQGEEEFFNYCYEICRYHHERYDGKGYPDRIAADSIPISAQVVSLADVYDALVSERVYKAAYEKGDAFQMIINGECGVFSPKLLECFRMVKEEFEEYADYFSDESRWNFE